ncbi:MAG: LamG-like jellyroll fold domain-containing protein [Myxococcota bacterium]
MVASTRWLATGLLLTTLPSVATGCLQYARCTTDADCDVSNTCVQEQCLPRSTATGTDAGVLLSSSSSSSASSASSASSSSTASSASSSGSSSSSGGTSSSSVSAASSGEPSSGSTSATSATSGSGTTSSSTAASGTGALGSTGSTSSSTGGLSSSSSGAPVLPVLHQDYTFPRPLELASDEPGLVALWHLNDSSWNLQSYVQDAVGSNHGTARGSASPDNGGKFGRGGTFLPGGSVEVPGLPTGTAFTVEAWVRDPGMANRNGVTPVLEQWGRAPTLSAQNLSLYDAANTGGLTSRGYLGAVFDGRYVYFVPHATPGRYHADVLRYDTRGDFSAATSWTAYDASNVDGLSTKGYLGGVFDGRYVYFIPLYDGTVHGRVLRLDTQGGFDEATSWRAVDVNALLPGAHGFVGGVFDGRHVYFAPLFNNTGGLQGRVVRLDTQGDFFSASAWELRDCASTDGLSTIGFEGAVFDGRYVYFVPFWDGAAIHGRVLRYDTHGSFQSATSWAAYNAGAVDGLVTTGYVGAVFDGRYVYFVPFGSDSGTHGRVLRYDTQAEFKAAGSWRAFAADTALGAPTAAGYHGGFFDGRYVHFVPQRLNGTTPHGRLLRYDTRGDFTQASSWSRLDMSTWNAGAVGYAGATFDGRYAYFAPYAASDMHGRVLRYDTTGGNAAWSVRMGTHASDGWSSSAGALTALVETTTGHHVLRAPLGGDTAWHHLALTHDGVTTTLWLDAVALDSVDGAGELLTPNLPFTMGGGAFSGSLDEVSLWNLAHDEQTLVDHATRDVVPAANPEGPLGRVTGASPALSVEEAAGGALFFDGNDDVVEVPDAPGLDGTDELTVAAWVRPQLRKPHGRVETLVEKWGRSPRLEAGNFAVHDATQEFPTAGGYWGAVFDGRYVYFAPQANGNVLRYDTRASLDDATAYELVDLTTLDPGAQGYLGAVFDGRYVYLVPYAFGGVNHGLVARVDTQGDFQTAWTFHDAGSVDGLGTKGYAGATFDGRYVYFAPYHDGVTSHARVLRLDTQGAFDDAQSWSAYDARAASGLDSRGFLGAVHDGRYVYFVPYIMDNAVHGKVLRYDTLLEFQDAAAWSARDRASVDGQTTVGFCGAVFDGQYLYFVPHVYGAYQPNGAVLRFDTLGSFTGNSSWQAYNISLLGTPGGYHLGQFDGQYVYFVPIGYGTTHAVLARYNTRGEFKSPTSWELLDAANVTAQTTQGYVGAAFDGRYLYLSPNSDGAVHARILRVDTTGGQGAYALRWSQPLNAGAGGELITAVLETSTDHRLITAPMPPDGAWHHVALRYTGNRVSLWLDGVRQVLIPAYGPVLDTNTPLRVGGGRFNGALDEVQVYSVAVPEEDLAAHVP